MLIVKPCHTHTATLTKFASRGFTLRIRISTTKTMAFRIEKLGSNVVRGLHFVGVLPRFSTSVVFIL